MKNCRKKRRKAVGKLNGGTSREKQEKKVTAIVKEKVRRSTSTKENRRIRYLANFIF